MIGLNLKVFFLKLLIDIVKSMNYKMVQYLVYMENVCLK